MIRAIVCGGRDYSDRQAVFSALDELLPDVVIQGAAKGADALAFEWCRLRHVECWNIPADWKKHGKAAGPIRNRRMIEEYRANLVVAFPGGAGTADMIRQAEAASIKVLRYPPPAAPPPSPPTPNHPPHRGKETIMSETQQLIEKIRAQLDINVEIAKRDHPEGPIIDGKRVTGVCHSQEILAGHIRDHLNELEKLIPALATPAQPESGLLAEAVKVPDGWRPPQNCDGKEQLAFEEWASGHGLDMHEHPLHYLFMDPKTDAARQAWKAALAYVRKLFSEAALATTPPPVEAQPVEAQGEAKSWKVCGHIKDKDPEWLKAASFATSLSAAPQPAVAVGEVERLKLALGKLIQASADVSKFGAQTGPQWVHLTTAIISARAALHGSEKGE